MRGKTLSVALVLALAAGPLACTPTQKGAVIGGATGAGAGALLDRHHRTRGAVIGGVAGGLVGGVIGRTYEITRFCPSCGRRFHRSKRFCPYDGTELHDRR
jgi:hypothetical protein